MSRDGLLPLDKPAGCTSHDVVARVRRLVGTRRVGHAGTLDPFATGLLLCLVGRATRLARFLQGLDKEYTGTIRLGIATDTGDRDGRPVGGPRPVPGDPDLVARAAAALEGPQDQVPPAYSAKKIEGTRAYRLARAGKPATIPPVRVVVHAFRPGVAEADLLPFRAHVSSGTYIRRLASDLGERLGCGAHLESLRRVAVGTLSLDEALDLDGLAPDRAREALMPLEKIPLGLPSRRLSPEQVEAVRHGRWLEAAGAEPDPQVRGDRVRLLDPEGRLVAIAERDAAPEPGRLRPRVVFS